MKCNIIQKQDSILCLGIKNKIMKILSTGGYHINQQNELHLLELSNTQDIHNLIFIWHGRWYNLFWNEVLSWNFHKIIQIGFLF